LGGGLGEVRAAGQGVEDLGLLSGKIRIVHGANFRLHDSARVGQGRGGRKVGIGCRSMKRWEQKNISKVCDRAFRRPGDFCALVQGTGIGWSGSGCNARNVLGVPELVGAV
jgi:hypothetical protein